MPTPKFGYPLLKNGKKPASVTQILGRFKESGALIQWAYNRGKNGLPLYESRDAAADIGTCVHGMVERSIRGKSVQHIVEYRDSVLAAGTGMREKAQLGYEAFCRWAQNYSVKVVSQERQMISEEYGFGGTPDFVGVVADKLGIFDIKTSKAIYPEMKIQVAAYGKLWDENNPNNPITGGFHILRFSKEDGAFAHHHYDDLTEEWEQFKAFILCYERDKRIKERGT